MDRVLHSTRSIFLGSFRERSKLYDYHRTKKKLNKMQKITNSQEEPPKINPHRVNRLLPL